MGSMIGARPSSSLSLRSRPLALLIALALLASCGGPRQRTRLGTEQSFTDIEAPEPSRVEYTTTVPAGDPVVGGGDTAAVQAGVAAAASMRGVTLTGDPRLATLSEWLVDRLGPAGEPPPSDVIDFLAWNLGLVEPTPHIAVLGLPDRATIETNVQSSVAQFLERQPYTHWGASVVARNGVWLVVVTLAFRHLELDAVPRQPAQGAAVTMHGTLASGFSNPVIVVQSPNGETTRQPAGAGPGFDVRVPALPQGRTQLEVLARGPHGEAVVANFPVYVGTEIPTALHLGPTESTGGEAQDAEGVRAELLRMLNETRAGVGLPPLTVDPRLDAVALAHTRDMIEHDFVGHASPTTGSAADRVRGAGLAGGLVLENIGRGYSASEIHRGLLDSPGHRANLVNPDANTIGIGVMVEDEGGRPAFLATQVFIRLARPIDVAAAPATVLEAINRARAARGAPALTIESNLAEAAQTAAEAFFTNPTQSQQDTIDQASASLRRFSIAFRRVGGVMAVVSTLSEATQLEPTLTDDVQLVGIGVAQGDRADTGPNSIAVVIVLGWAR